MVNSPENLCLMYRSKLCYHKFRQLRSSCCILLGSFFLSKEKTAFLQSFSIIMGLYHFQLEVRRFVLVILNGAQRSEESLVGFMIAVLRFFALLRMT